MNAGQFFDQWYKENPDRHILDGSIRTVMQDFAEYHVTKALECAARKALVCVHHETEGGTVTSQYAGTDDLKYTVNVFVDNQSILTAYQIVSSPLLT